MIYFVIFPIQYNTIQYYKKVDLRRVKYIKERLNEIRGRGKAFKGLRENKRSGEGEG